MSDSAPYPISRAQALNAAISTPRLVMEPLLDSHADALFPAMADPCIYRWIDVPLPQQEQTRAKWKSVQSRVSRDGSQALLNWAVRRIADRAYIGWFDVQLNTADEALNVGFAFVPDAWGSGFASEALQAVLARLAKEGVRRARATVAIGNHASERVLLKSGFVAVGLAPDEKDTMAYVLDPLR